MGANGRRLASMNDGVNATSGRRGAGDSEHETSSHVGETDWKTTRDATLVYTSY